MTDFFLQEKFLEVARLKLEKTGIDDKLMSGLHPASDEYLFAALKLSEQEFGYPRKTAGFSATVNMRDPFSSLEKDLKEYDKLSKRISNFLGAPINAVAVLYPENGWMGWHHNGNAPGYNILFSYSVSGEGSFDYWDMKNNKIVEMKDSPGWNVKVGRFPGYRDGKDKLFWHRAKTQTPRITIAWILDQKELWIDMIKEISDNNFDQSILTHR